MTTKKLSAIILAVVLLSRMMIRSAHAPLKNTAVLNLAQYGCTVLLVRSGIQKVPPGY